MAYAIVFDPIKCDGRGLCAELLPERIELDDWGFPVISKVALTPDLIEHAKNACSACPLGALKLVLTGD